MPAIGYDTPRWIGQPADPAAHYQAGFQIGMHLGAQQAAQMYQAQQLEMQRQRELMAAQEHEVERSYQAQVLGMKAQEMARKHQANYEFRSRVASGEDPSQVLMELAPELGENPASIIHDRASEGQSQALMAFRQANMRRLDQASQERLAATKEVRDQALAEKKAEFQQRENRLKTSSEARLRQAAENAILRDPTLKTLRSTADDLKSNVSALSTDKWSITHPTRTAAVIKEEKTAAQKSLDETLADIAKREQEIRSHFKNLSSEIDPEDPNFNPEAWPVPEPQMPVAAATPGVAGDNTMPDQPTAPAVKRLRFTGAGFQEVK